MIADYQTLEKETDKKGFLRHPVKITALEYIREALQEERYEEVRGMIEIAKEFGASAWDIRIAFVPGFSRKAS